LQLKRSACVGSAGLPPLLRGGLLAGRVRALLFGKSVAFVAFVALAALVGLTPSVARAQVAQVDGSYTIYHEAPTRTNMTVLTPATDITVRPTQWLTVKAGYEADVVSGASIAVKAGPAYAANNPGADVVTAASVNDVRHAPRGGFSLKKGDVTFLANYSYSTENDYKSNAFNIGARTEIFEHNTQLEIGYARNFDRVCDRVQGANDNATKFRALEDSTGCFTEDPLRTTRSVGVDGYQGSWSQAWSPVFVTQLVYTGQLQNGFLSNAYRSVIVGQGQRAQEHHPEDRARHALALRGNVFVRPLRLAVRFGLRAYADSWGVKSGTGDVEVEKIFGENLRLTGSGRFYKQTGALFFSDDYTGGDVPLGPKGQYFTGDRELSSFFSVLTGLRLGYGVTAQEKKYLGFIQGLRVGLSASVQFFRYEDFTLGGEGIGAARAWLFGLSGGATF
jgi:hypothetical protein